MSISSDKLLDLIGNNKTDENGENLNEATIKANAKAKANISLNDLKSDILSRDDNMMPFIKAHRKRVIVVTPFLAESLDKKQKYERYAMQATQNSFKNNEAPISSQSMYFGLSGTSGTNLERDASFVTQLNWLLKADLVAFYIDYGITPAMESMINFCLRKNIICELRKIGEYA